MSLLHDFHAFCKSQPPTRWYPFEHCERCALGQFLAIIGQDWVDVGSIYSGTEEGQMLDTIAQTHPHYFGALADRLARQIENPRTQEQLDRTCAASFYRQSA